VLSARLNTFIKYPDALHMAVISCLFVALQSWYRIWSRNNLAKTQVQELGSTIYKIWISI